MAKNYVIDGGTGELDVGGNTLANRFDLPDAMPPKRQNLGERFGFKKGSQWSDYINPGEWAQGYPSEEVREDFKQDVGHAWDFAKHAGKELIKDFTPVQGEARAIGYALEEKEDLAKALQDKKYIEATGKALNTQLMSLSALPWWTGVGAGAKVFTKLARMGKTYANFANAKKLQKLELGTPTTSGRPTPENPTRFFTKKDQNSKLNPLLDKLDEADLTAFLKRKINNKHFNDLNFYKAFDKYKDTYHGGNLAKAEKTILEGTGRGTDYLRGMARIRKYDLGTLGKTGSKSKVGDIEVSPYKTVNELSNAIVKDETNIADVINARSLDTSKFYSMRDMAKVLGFEDAESARKALISYLYQKPLTKGGKFKRTNKDVKTIKDPANASNSLYNLGDVLNNIENFALKSGPGGTKKTILGTYDVSKTTAAREAFTKKWDPELDYLKMKFETGRFQGPYTHGDPAIIQLMKSGKFKKTGGKFAPDTGINKDWGHGFNVEHVNQYDFIKNSPANKEKMYSLNNMVLQDSQINQNILAKSNYRKQEKDLFDRIDKFLKNNKDKRFNAVPEEVTKINKELEQLLLTKRKDIKAFIKDKPFLKGQEDLLMTLKLNVKPGKGVTMDDVIINKDYFKPGKFSLGQIKSIDPKAVTMADLSDKNKKIFKQTVYDQQKANLEDAAKYDPKWKDVIEESLEEMDWGYSGGKEGTTRRGFLSDKTGELRFATGGPVVPRIEYRDGTRMSPQPPKEKSFEDIVKELQIQYGIPDEEGFAVKDKLGRLGDIVDPRNYPYYGSKVGKGIMEAAEFSVRFPGAAGQLIHDVATGPGWKEQGLDFIKMFHPVGVGLKKLDSIL